MSALLPSASLSTPPQHRAGTGDDQYATAVQEFTLRDSSADKPGERYRGLIPWSLPDVGQQYAFEVDLDACSGCKACVVACHNINGLEEDELWRSVGLLHGGSNLLPVLQHVTTACHHCLEPACLQGCPVQAYEKDPRTGIVRHLDEQCIGCQYCILMCPYDVPKYSKRQGIVRKCDMCRTRLAASEAPACVEACPTRAIRISLIDRQDAADNCETNLFLPGAPEPEHTLPTTVYKTSRALPGNLLPADYYCAAPQHAHWPLVFMLVLTQASVGVLLAGCWLGPIAGEKGALVVRQSVVDVACLLGALGIAASMMHLGRPWYAFRAILGLRTSWLSREILAFSFYGVLMVLCVALPRLQRTAVRMPSELIPATGAAARLWGILGVGCSVMIYARTRRAFWAAAPTGAKFVLTCVILGLAIMLLLEAIAAAGPGEAAECMAAASDRLRECRWLAAAVLAKLFCEGAVFTHLRRKRHGPLKRTALLMVGELKSVTQGRFALGLFGGVLLPLAMAGGFFCGATHDADARLVVAAHALVVAALLMGELMERFLFFTAVVAPKMPGAPAS